MRAWRGSGVEDGVENGDQGLFLAMPILILPIHIDQFLVISTSKSLDSV